MKKYEYHKNLKYNQIQKYEFKYKYITPKNEHNRDIPCQKLAFLYMQ